MNRKLYNIINNILITSQNKQRESGIVKKTRMKKRHKQVDKLNNANSLHNILNKLH